MGIRYYGTPTTLGTYDGIMCRDREGNLFELTVVVERSGEVDPPEHCYLLKYDRNSNATKFVLPLLSSIEEEDTATLAEISTIVYGFDENFVMDLGTVQRYNVDFVRVQPPDYDDTSDDSSRWSNGYYYRKLKEFLDGWQNLNWGFYDTATGGRQFGMTGGFRFHYEPPVETNRENQALYSNLYPVVDRNVFIAGSIQMPYSNNSPQKMTFTLPLAVASMRASSETRYTYTVTYNPGDVEATSFAQNFPVGVKSIVPNVPMDWLKEVNGKAFHRWNVNGYGYAYPGGRVPPEYTAFVAEWLAPKYVFAWDDPDEDWKVSLSSFQMSEVSVLTYYIVGPGGKGGHGYSETVGWSGFGGGGGSGGYKVGQIFVQGPLYIEAHVGDSTWDASDYSSLNITNLTLNAMVLEEVALSGKTGGNAKNSSTPGKGGAGGSPGGYKGNDATIHTGGLGGYVEDLNGLLVEASVDAYYNGVSVPNKVVGPFTSACEDLEHDTDPKYGGGGTGDRRSGAYGADGLVVIALS